MKKRVFLCLNVLIGEIMNGYVIYDQNKEMFWCWVKKELKRRSEIKYFTSREIDDKIPFWTNDFEHARVLGETDFMQFGDYKPKNLIAHSITYNIFDSAESMAKMALLERKDHLVVVPVIDGEPCFNEVKLYE